MREITGVDRQCKLEKKWIQRADLDFQLKTHTKNYQNMTEANLNQEYSKLEVSTWQIKTQIHQVMHGIMKI